MGLLPASWRLLPSGVTNINRSLAHTPSTPVHLYGRLLYCNIRSNGESCCLAFEALSWTISRSFERTTIFRNVWHRSHNDADSHPKKPDCSSTPLWQPVTFWQLVTACDRLTAFDILTAYDMLTACDSLWHPDSLWHYDSLWQPVTFWQFVTACDILTACDSLSACDSLWHSDSLWQSGSLWQPDSPWHPDSLWQPRISPGKILFFRKKSQYVPKHQCNAAPPLRWPGVGLTTSA